MTSFASPTDLEARLGQTFDMGEAARAQTLLDLATSLLQDATEQTISLVEDDEYVRPGSYETRILLPERPVVEVASVTAVWLNGDPYTFPSESWYLDGSEIVRTSFPLGLEYGFETHGRGWLGERATLTIVYTHGYDDDAIPGLVKATCLEQVRRVWTNPNAVVQETYGSESITYQDNDPGLLPTPAEVAAVNKKIRRMQGSVKLR